MNHALLEEAKQVKQQADCIHDAAAVDQALDRMAAQITRDLGDKTPLLISVMNGGLIPGGLLLSRLDFPLKTDYLHATRYREETVGSDLMWQHAPSESLTGRHVLIIDDILDEGHTLEAIIRYCRKQQPASLSSAVLAQKEHDRGVRPPLEYVGLTVPDRYVFGCGMDYKGYWRNLKGIYAVAE